MRIDEINERKEEIRSLINTEGAEFDVDALTKEVRALDAEAEEIRKKAAEEAELRAAVAPEVIAEIKENKTEIEERKMENIEIRNTPAYIDAYAEFMKTGKDAECRKLLTENVSGGVAVPELVVEQVKHAWDADEIMSRVTKTYMVGNVKVGFEKTAGAATVHTEGTDAPDEESLALGIAELIPASLKKWIYVSDEAMDLRGEAFINYVFGEIGQKIVKLAADTLIGKITACPTASSASQPAVAQVTATTIAATTIATALGMLSDEARNPVVIMNKQSLAAFRAVQAANNYGYDIFEGLTVLYNNSLPAFSAASSGNCYAIVGDLGEGAQANFPNGEEVTLKVDDLSHAEEDLVKIVGRQYVGMGVVAPFAFCQILK